MNNVTDEKSILNNHSASAPGLDELSNALHFGFILLTGFHGMARLRFPFPVLPSGMALSYHREWLDPFPFSQFRPLLAPPGCEISHRQVAEYGAGFSECRLDYRP